MQKLHVCAKQCKELIYFIDRLVFSHLQEGKATWEDKRHSSECPPSFFFP